MGDGSGHFPFGAGREAMKVPQATVIAATANRSINGEQPTRCSRSHAPAWLFRTSQPD